MFRRKNTLKKKKPTFEKEPGSSITKNKTMVFSMDSLKSNKLKLVQTLPPNLVLIYGPEGDIGKHWPVKRKKMSIGRDQKNEICIPEGSVSKSHVMVHYLKNKVMIEDLGSTNGTFLNDRKQLPNTQVTLNDNDTVRMGNIVLKFLDRGNPEIISIIDSFKKAFYDPLTGAGNKAMFKNTAPRMFKLCKQKRIPFSIVIFDIDHFKKVNDVYGHLAGDTILKGVSEVAQTCFRKKDIFARVGGEEFCIILTCSPNKAKSIVEDIRKKIAKHKFSYKDKSIRISISGGIAGLKDKDPGYLAMYERADQALYKAKGKGRNRVYIAR